MKFKKIIVSFLQFCFQTPVRARSCTEAFRSQQGSFCILAANYHSNTGSKEEQREWASWTKMDRIPRSYRGTERDFDQDAKWAYETHEVDHQLKVLKNSD